MSNGVVLQVIPQFAPKEFQLFISWAQTELDELDFVGLLVSFEAIASELPRPPAQRQS